MNDLNKKIDLLWDDNPIDVTAEANFIWSIANQLRGVYLPDKYGDVIIPMTILRRLECTLEATKAIVLKEYSKDPNTASQVLQDKSGLQFYNTSNFDLKELQNDPDNLAENFKNYIDGFSHNVVEIFESLELEKQIDKMDKGGCLLTVVKAFSELDLNPTTYDSIKMGYIFENLIGRFFQNVDAGQYYTGRDIIKCLVSILTSEGSEDIFEDHKIVTVCDQACGTGGMLSTTYSYLKHINNTIDVRLFGQEYNPVSYAIGLAEMLIKGQNASYFRQADTFKEDCFKNIKMRYVIENPPFGTPWKGKDAKAGQEKAVITEYNKEFSRWGAGLPGGGDSQLLFMQSAIDKMDDKIGRAAIIENGSPLFSGDTKSGESQIRRWMLENDLIEAIIALPTDLFYNTGIPTYVWVLSKNKREARKGKIQLINASSIYHKLRKSVGNKRNELTPEDRKKITELYVNFEENEFVKIFDNTEFIYREYTIMQPLQRSYAINEERIENLLIKGSLSSFYDEAKIYELENKDEKLNEKEIKTLETLKSHKEEYDNILSTLHSNISDKIFYNLKDFENYINPIFEDTNKTLVNKLIDGLSIMDKQAEIQKDKKGNIIYDKETKDKEIVKWNININDYMKEEVLPNIPDAKAFFEGKNENASFDDDKGESVIKIGAEIPFNSYFYKYKKLKSSSELLKEFVELEKNINKEVEELFNE